MAGSRGSWLFRALLDIWQRKGIITRCSRVGVQSTSRHVWQNRPHIHNHACLRQLHYTRLPCYRGVLGKFPIARDLCGALCLCQRHSAPFEGSHPPVGDSMPSKMVGDVAQAVGRANVDRLVSKAERQPHRPKFPFGCAICIAEAST